VIAEVHKSRTRGNPGLYILRGVGPSMELASCHPSHAKKFEMAPRFLENF
jgi:hypothetical protein